MIARIQRRRHGDHEEDGFSLIELLMVMVVFSIVGAIIVSVTTMMLRQQRRANSVGDNLLAARKILSRLDSQVRYANAVTTPGTAADGNYYVEWRSGNALQQQTCTQWRLVPSTNQLQFRTWQPKLGSPGNIVAGSQTSWATLASTITLTGSTPIFLIQPTTATSANTHEQLTVVFTSTSGTPAVPTSNQITITALNTSSPTPPTGLCNEVARS